MEKIKQLEEQLSSMIQTQLCNPEHVDTKELGEVVDMLKDLSEFCYYKTITEAMEGEDKENSSKKTSYYTRPDYYPDYSTPDRIYYYGGNGNSNNGNSSYYSDNNMRANGGKMYLDSNSMMTRDSREGRSPINRKMYMESKEMHKGTDAQMRELERYMQELTKDMTEIIEEATPEEKQLLQQKISMLASKIK